MPAGLRSIRLKLAGAFIISFAVVLAGISFAAVGVVERQLRGYFDDELTDRARQMVASLVQSPDPLTTRGLQQAIDQEVSSVYFRDFYVQARDLDGRDIARSDNLRVYSLPFESRWLSRPDGEHFMQTIQGRDVELLVGTGQKMRMVALRFNSPGIKPFYLQVATSLEHVDTSIRLLRRSFWWGVPLSLAAAALASWLVASGAVRRLRQVSAQVRDMKPESLEHRRLPSRGARDEIGDLIENLDSMLARLDAGFKAQQRFIQDASHELKTPLAILHSQAQVFQMNERTADESRRFARSVAEEVRHLSELVDSLLTLTRTEGRVRPARMENVALHDVTVAAVEAVFPLAQQQGVPLQLELPEPVDGAPDLTVPGDPQLLTAMISNLIRNAVRFSPADRPIEVRLEALDAKAVITVRDYGPGIPAEAVDRIFERFARADNPADNRGTGLGLAIARTVAQLHQGTIAAENLVVGCRFRVTLPLNSPAD